MRRILVSHHKLFQAEFLTLPLNGKKTFKVIITATVKLLILKQL